MYIIKFLLGTFENKKKLPYARHHNPRFVYSLHPKVGKVSTFHLGFTVGLMLHKNYICLRYLTQINRYLPGIRSLVKFFTRPLLSSCLGYGCIQVIHQMHISSIEHEGQKKVGKPRTIELQKACPCLIILNLS